MPRLYKGKSVPRRGGMRKSAPRRAPASRMKKASIVHVRQRVLPDKMIVKLPYADLSGINGSGLASWYTQKAYNINGLYDPETASLNQQNLGFQQYMGLYNKYRVFKVDYDVTLINTSQSAVAGSISFNKLSEQMMITDVQQLNLPYSRRFTLGLGGNSTVSSAKSMIRIRGSIYLPRVVGKTAEQYRVNDDYFGSVSSNPSEGIQMSLNFININQGIQATIQADVRYTCHVELFDRSNVSLIGTSPAVDV